MDRGAATYEKGRLEVLSPLEYCQINYRDPTKETGFVHSYLRPYQGIVQGHWNSREGRLVELGNVEAVVFVLVETPLPPGLRCAGALSFGNTRNGHTFCFFPALPRRGIEDREVDHLSAHIRFESGKVVASNIHAKIRLEGNAFATENVDLNNLRMDQYHFAFECWWNEAALLDPSGSVIGDSKIFRDSIKKAKNARSQIRRIQPQAFACSAPTEDGLLPPRLPMLVRVGVITDTGILKKGGTDKAISQPKAIGSTPFATRLHRFKDIHLIAQRWPRDVSLFVEIGLLPEKKRKDYMLPDVSKAELGSHTPVRD